MGPHVALHMVHWECLIPVSRSLNIYTQSSFFALSSRFPSSHSLVLCFVLRPSIGARAVPLSLNVHTKRIANANATYLESSQV